MAACDLNRPQITQEISHNRGAYVALLMPAVCACQTGAEMNEGQMAELQVLRERIVEVQALQVRLCFSYIVDCHRTAIEVLKDESPATPSNGVSCA